MKTPSSLGSWLAIAGALALVSVAVARFPQTWTARVCEPDIFLAAFTCLCTAALLWPRPARVANLPAGGTIR